jgi:hypothetical protein
MYNYIIEDSLDFKKELNKNDDVNIINNVNDNNNIESIETCLISQQQLTKSHIILPCNHKFNYMPLFNEVCSQKQKNIYESCTLKLYQIKCPYCRKIFDNLLPYIPSEYSEKKTGINYPLKYCMSVQLQCDWVNTKGKHKNINCTRTVMYICDKSYCKHHYDKTQLLQEHRDIEV